jgi:hypothetical protein
MSDGVGSRLEAKSQMEMITEEKQAKENDE